MPRWLQTFIHIFLGGLILCGALGLSSQAITAQTPDPADPPDVEAIFESMSPRERVGQLFVITFNGATVEDNSSVARLIRDYRVGGVWLQQSNKTRPGEGEEPAQAIQTLINTLQAYTFQPAQITTPLTVSTALTPAVGSTATARITPTPIVSAVVSLDSTAIPLFIAADYEGNGYPYTLLTPELTDVPSGMALGATWNPQYATQVGEIVGRELSALGVNVVFGPVLDVVDKPGTASTGVSGVRAFGGDPYWVGKMGRAYIQGVHAGSQGRVLTVAKHFPGAGSIDRQLNQDIPTIQKLLDQLKLVEMVPFFSVTAVDSAKPAEITDGLMTAHIRYRGLQGNIRDLTKPISLDPQNMPGILKLLPQLWRDGGGLVVSGPLGVPAVEKTYKVESGFFPAKQIAVDAFLAGSDVLLLSDFDATDSDQAQFDNIVAAIEFFQSKYETDPVFKQLVDTSVRRILTAKLKLYPAFEPEQVMSAPEDLAVLSSNPGGMFEVVRDGVTLIYPETSELADRLPSPPLEDESIIIFTDDRRARLCADCNEFYLLPPDALQSAILSRYGPDGSVQIKTEQIHSYTFTDLANTLDANPQTPDLNNEIDRRLKDAAWIVFAMLDVNEAQYPSSAAVKRFLGESPLDLRDKKIIVLAFDAPYYLDNTEVSILTAYYGLYNKTQNHIEAAVRLLFKEFSPQGHSPVNIDAVEYKIPDVLEPDPKQTIALEYFKGVVTQTVGATPTVEGVAEGTVTPVAVTIEEGEQLTLRTGVIVDRNGNPVPDNTLVSFNRSYPKEGLTLAPIIAPTINGIAETVITRDREGTLEITVKSGETVPTGKIIIEGSLITVETPTPTPTAPPTETPTVTPTETPTPTPTATPTVIPLPTVTPTPDPAGLIQPPALAPLDLFLSLLMLVVLGAVVFLFFTSPKAPLEVRLWPVLMLAAVGLIGYVLYGIFAVQIAAINGLGTFIRGNTKIHWLTPLVTTVFGLMGVGVVYLTEWVKARRDARPEPEDSD